MIGLLSPSAWIIGLRSAGGAVCRPGATRGGRARLRTRSCSYPGRPTPPTVKGGWQVV